jgi:peptide/nickel transport system permease protein
VRQLRYAGRRIVQMIPVLILVTIGSFLLLKLLPGDPAAMVLGDKASDAAIAAFRHQLGLDRPLVTQYLLYVQHLATGDLGTSIIYRTPVTHLLGPRAEVTAFLVVYSMVLGIIIAVPLAFAAALNADRWPDQLVRVLTTIPLVSPTFWIGLLLLLVFAVHLRWLPATGFGEGFGHHLLHLFLPALTLSLSFAGLLARNLRAAILDALGRPFVDFARSKGLSRRTIMYRHVLRAALVSIVTIVGLQLSYAIGGAVVTETVFALPGLGTWMMQSIFARDYQVVQSLTFIFAAGTILINLLTDLTYSVLDPRVTVR